MNRLALMAALAWPVASGRAFAHAIIVDSAPAPYAHMAPGTLHVVLRYNSRIDAGRSKLTLRLGDDTRRLPADADAPPDTLSAQASVAPGQYDIAWQVLATDGHVTRGHVPFTVDPAKADTPR